MTRVYSVTGTFRIPLSAAKTHEEARAEAERRSGDVDYTGLLDLDKVESSVSKTPATKESGSIASGSRRRRSPALGD